MKNVILTGSSGYIGSHVKASLVKNGYECNGAHATAAIHCAGIANIPDSISDPMQCYSVNVCYTIALLESLKSQGIDKIVFLSTNVVDGSHPYGKSKKICEQIIQDSGLKYAILRLFNVAGCDPKIEGKWKRNYRLIPMLVKAAESGEPFTMYGGGNQTRDYIHVSDVADIIVDALENLKNDGFYHLKEVGTGRGASIRNLIAIVEEISGKKINVIDGGTREGDVYHLVAEKNYIKLEHSSLENIVSTTWQRRDSFI